MGHGVRAWDGAPVAAGVSRSSRILWFLLVFIGTSSLFCYQGHTLACLSCRHVPAPGSLHGPLQLWWFQKLPGDPDTLALDPPNSGEDGPRFWGKSGVHRSFPRRKVVVYTVIWTLQREMIRGPQHVRDTTVFGA